LLATGHFRHGIILGPLTGHLVTQLLQGKTTDWDLAPYAPARFAAVPAGSRAKGGHPQTRLS
ncbi:MAG TPA: hypothetical protein VIU62_14895, partial [Chloroflexota bacterium]